MDFSLNVLYLLFRKEDKIMDYNGILKFKYTWRKYQARVLENTQKYVSDGRVHIVAAPGSGKTTLGIELIARMRGHLIWQRDH